MRFAKFLLFFLGFGLCFEIVCLTDQEQQALNDALVLNAANGSLENVQQALREGAQINALCSPSIIATRDGRLSALFAAGLNGHAAIVKFLLNNDADINLKEMGGNCPLTDIVLQGKAGTPQVVALLLQAGANPNGGPTAMINVPSALFIVYGVTIDRSVLRLLLLYGGHVSDKYKKLFSKPRTSWVYRLLGYITGTTEPEPSPHDKHLIEKFNQAVPNTLLQAIVLNDPQRVQAFLSKYPAHESKDVVKDSEGVSTLAYAAGQGNEQILGLLLAHSAYQYDTTGLEQALEIVASRLRGLEAGSSEYKKYEKIFNDLKRELGTTYIVLMKQLGGTEYPSGELHHAPWLPGSPPEINDYILKLATPGAYQALFSHSR
jgi:ankyrin repeat protein